MQKAGDRPIPFIDTVLQELSDTQDWPRDEKITTCFDLTSTIDADLLFPPEVMQKIESKEVGSIHDIEPGSEGIGWFCITSAEMKKTKNGLKLLQIGVDGESTNIKLKNLLNHRVGKFKINN